MMDAERWARIQEILSDALDAEPDARASIIEAACAGDAELKAEVESLVAASEEADDYFDGLADRAGITRELEEGEEPAAAPDLTGRHIGAYRLGRLLGRGGMGAVYLAERADDHFDLTAALKLLPVGAASDEAHRRFLEERRILARLEHPNIARLLDGGVTDDGTPYFVMEYVEGIPLTAYARSELPKLERRLELFLDVCDAVAYAHRKLIIHRDIKPNNILVTRDGQVKLLDFGIASIMEREDAHAATTHGRRLMTPRYASPEQLRGDPVSTASDIYSLGVILHEVLTGLSPYELDSTDVSVLVKAVCERPVTTPSTRLARSVGEGAAEGPTLPGDSPAGLSRRLRGDLDNIVLMALRKEPERRYPSVEALADDLRRHLGGYPVRARSESLGYVASRFMKRHALAVGAAALLLVLLGTMVIMSVRFAVASGEQARAVERERDKAQEIAGFMRELFEVANPALTNGETVTARELLDRGAERIREDHGGEPEVAAQMMTVLGTVYHHLGLPQPALELLEEARTLQAANPEISDTERGETLYQLGLALRDVGRAEEAATVLEEAREVLRSVHGDDHRSVALASFGLGKTMHHLGRVAEAEPEFRQAVEIFRRLELSTDDAYTEALYLLAEYLNVKGETEGVEELYREALTALETKYGRNHPNVPPVLLGLAWVMNRQEDPDSATALLRAALEIDLRLYGTVDGGHHPAIAESHMNLGRHLARHGDASEAETHLRQAVETFEAASRPTPDMHGTALLTLADMLREQGRRSEALAAYDSSVALLREAYGAGSLMEASVLVQRGRLLLDLGRPGEAAADLRTALDDYLEVMPETHQRISEIRALLQQASEALPG